MENKHPIVLYDGVCNLCSGVVKFTLQRDRQGRLRYAALQSDTGKRLLLENGFARELPDTFIFIENGKAYTKSSAALRLARHLGGGFRVLSGLLIIPRPLRDVFYTFVANNRYRWFGRSESCMLMRPEYRERFLE
ncbi:thiol-disulfide oxidoreductase DCC family protein [Paenibacillus thermotolerans]|uniref:thiol-disulfide oxidoreductase DCC family protein n=1 Tax=Paenibacillus thermotolerans TaxID=3027807 RepID=UPI002367A044|nr:MULTISPECIES: thiol-disulfide oxidoreductase DCC family protein [unclassified Paenibacillus]